MSNLVWVGLAFVGMCLTWRLAGTNRNPFKAIDLDDEWAWVGTEGET